jgi:hypothetical protein
MCSCKVCDEVVAVSATGTAPDICGCCWFCASQFPALILSDRRPGSAALTGMQEGGRMPGTADTIASVAEIDKLNRLSPHIWCLTWIKVGAGQAAQYGTVMLSMLERYQHHTQHILK